MQRKTLGQVLSWLDGDDIVTIDCDFCDAERNSYAGYFDDIVFRKKIKDLKTMTVREATDGAYYHDEIGDMKVSDFYNLLVADIAWLTNEFSYAYITIQQPI